MSIRVTTSWPVIVLVGAALVVAGWAVANLWQLARLKRMRVRNLRIVADVRRLTSWMPPAVPREAGHWNPPSWPSPSPLPLLQPRSPQLAGLSPQLAGLSAQRRLDRAAGRPRGRHQAMSMSAAFAQQRLGAGVCVLRRPWVLWSAAPTVTTRRAWPPDGLRAQTRVAHSRRGVRLLALCLTVAMVYVRLIAWARIAAARVRPRRHGDAVLAWACVPAVTIEGQLVTQFATLDR